MLDSEVGFWIYTNKSSIIYHYNITGDVINKLDLSKLINNCNNCVVTSKITIVGFISNVTLIVAIGDSSNNYILGNSFFFVLKNRENIQNFLRIFDRIVKIKK